MHIYRINSTYDDESTHNLMCDKCIISLPKNSTTAQFIAGKTIFVLRDKYLDFEDIAYLCDGVLYLNKVPYIFDEWGCQCLIEYVGGLSDGKLDRLLLKFAISKISKRDGILPIELARRNLLSMITKGR